MQVENRNAYNTLGRMGPLYPRPEYRPPQNAPERTGGGTGEAGKGTDGKGGTKSGAPSESLILSGRLRKASSPPAADPSARLNVQSAAELARDTAGRIAGLDPRSERGCPHRKPEGHGLLYPAYA
jgi:hypothetical protein